MDDRRNHSGSRRFQSLRISRPFFKWSMVKLQCGLGDWRCLRNLRFKYKSFSGKGTVFRTDLVYDGTPKLKISLRIPSSQKSVKLYFDVPPGMATKTHR